MESVQSIFDGGHDYAVDFGLFAESHTQLQQKDDVGIELPGVDASACQTDWNSVTLTSLNMLNSHDTDNENFFDLGFEGGDLDCVVDLASDGPTVKQEEPNRSPSPMSCMSMTASLSGSEPYSSPRQSEKDETEQDLLEYLLHDSDMTHHDADEDIEDGITVTSVGAMTRSKRQKTFRRSSSSSIQGVNGQGGPWCKTKNRNSSKNAVAARENRQKKKMYMQALEDANEQLSEENSRLKRESTQAKQKVGSLEGEVQYLRKVLFNQSALAGLLKKMNQSDVRLGFSGDDAPTSSSGGVCLHVNGEDASLKFCASCARNDHL